MANWKLLTIPKFLIFFNKQLFKYYSLTVLVFLGLLSHWFGRLYDIIFGGGSKFWLQSPNLDDLIHFTSSIFNVMNILIILTILAGLGVTTTIIKKEELFGSKTIKAIIIYSILISFVTVALNYIISFSIPLFLDRYLLYI